MIFESFLNRKKKMKNELVYFLQLSENCVILFFSNCSVKIIIMYDVLHFYEKL